MLSRLDVLPPLHDWQVACLASYTAAREIKNDFLIVASVGSGKTRVALESAAQMVIDREISRVIVLTGTTHLIKQWGRAASKAGLRLVQVFGNKDLKDWIPDDSHGYVCTYHSMGSWPDLHEALATSARTLVIFDEIHHLADNPDEAGKSVWGDRAKQCFSDAAFRLALSGTPFRTTGERIPFVEYDEDPKNPGEFVCKPDFTYQYGAAVADEICRRVVFKPYDADPSWTRKIMFTESGMDLNVTFADELADQSLRNARLWASTHIRENDDIPDDLNTCKWPFLVKMIREADRKLQDLRAGDHPDAGGIIVCGSADHARGIHKLFKRITRSRAIVVVHEDPSSAKALEAYTKGSTPWIIAVRMVSEGVDIPRLRVCVYLSWWTAVVYFMQVLGRIVRYPKHPAEPWGESYFYFPADSRLKATAEKVEDELKGFLRERKEPRDGGHGGEKPTRQAIHSEGDEQQNITSGSPFTATDIEAADAARRELGLGRISLIELLRFWEYVRKRPAGPGSQPSDDISYDELRDENRDEAQRLVGRLSFLTGRPHDHLHHEANVAAGIRKTGKATLDQLKAKVAWLREQAQIAREAMREEEEDE